MTIEFLDWIHLTPNIVEWIQERSQKLVWSKVLKKIALCMMQKLLDKDMDMAKVRNTKDKFMYSVR